MQQKYFQQHSDILCIDIECKLYGYAGRPVLFIPCQDGRFFDFENFHMLDAWKPWLENGQVMVLSVDTLDRETWSNQTAAPYDRIRRHEAWMQHIIREIVPFLQALAMESNGWNMPPGILAFGCSLGATHAANLYFRWPEYFDSLLALSGIYTAAYGFGDYMDEVVYANSPVHYLAQISSDHPYITMYNQHKAVICVGQGAWEAPDTTRQVDTLCAQKGIHLWVDYWGYDCSHDWPWWFKQVAYFLPYLIDK